MVRLKEEVVSASELYEALFQFHNGSIKSCAPLNYQDGNRLFQFHNGSIKSNPSVQDAGRTDHVSIPQWFD